MSIKRHIPNSITLLNLLSGCIAILFAAQGEFVIAAFFVFLGIFFDFFDGLLARKLKVQSPLGIQLDSLADLVTSGVVPGIIMYKLIALSLNTGNIVFSKTWNETVGWEQVSIEINGIALIAFLIPLASAYRLARFNIDEDQQTYFKGLPVPANTLLILSLPLILEFQNNDLMNRIIINPWFLISMTFLSAYLLNSKIKLFALKFKDWSFKTNSTRYVFLTISMVLLVVLQFAAIPPIIIVYVLSSVLDSKNIT